MSDSLVQTDRHGNRVFGGELHASVANSIERLGMVYLGREILTQEVHNFTGLSQILLKFHLYHWLYDSVACLDSLARVLNVLLDLGIAPREVNLNRRFIGILESRQKELSRVIDKEYVWIEDLRNMRSTIIHREGRLITGGGQEPCFVWDFQRAFNPNIDLNRVKLPDLVDEFMPKIDFLCHMVISEVLEEQKRKGFSSGQFPSD
mgnify:CR=1 FL=1